MKTQTRSRARLRLALSALAAAAMCTLALGVAAASAAFEITHFDGEVTTAAGEPATQAGSHPYEATTEINFSESTDGSGAAIPDGNFKDLLTELPAGLIGDPQAVPKCSIPDFEERPPEIIGINAYGTCPNSTVVGTSKIVTPGFFPTVWVSVYNLEPGPSGAPRFGLHVLSASVLLEFVVRTGGDYGLDVKVRNASQGLPVIGTQLTFWGVPGDPSHDAERGTCLNSFGGSTGKECPSGLSSPKPLLSNPTSCTGPVSTSLHAVSWQEPQNWADVSKWQSASFLSHDKSGTPIGVDGCNRLSFEPSLSVSPTPGDADSPSGLDVEIKIPQNDDPNGLASAQLKDATVTLPDGVTVNAAAANGLQACSAAQIGIGNDASPTCPAASRLGVAEVDTPLLENPLKGSVYLAKQGENKFGSLLAIYLVAEGSGQVIKLPGKVVANSAGGQVTASFENNPQIPFEALKLSFFGGDGAALSAPRTCGSYTASGTFTPWSGTAPVHRESTFAIAAGPGGGACPSGGGFNPRLRAGTVNPVAAASSPFQLELSREDGTQRFATITARLPLGLLGQLKGIPYCPDSALAGIPTAEGTGAAQLASSTCPAASQVGTVGVGAGTGASPFQVNTGRAYLAGPYKGAPLSMAFVTPALAGPFDLGNVVVRAALEVDPVTTAITVKSDPLPRILAGIPLDLRNVRVNIDRPQFTLNPTSCDPMSVGTTVSAAEGATASPSVRFQATDCASLGFAPKLAIKLSGKTHRSAHPALKATLTMPQGGANIEKAQVTLPKTEFLENAHIKTICTRVQYAAKACPQESIYGYARAWSPLLDKPLQGPVYLRSSNHKLPDLVVSLDGQIHIDLAGRIDAVNSRIRNTFEMVPDAPVSKFELTMQGGKKGLLVNNTELCKAKPVATVSFDAHSGKTAEANPLVKADCGKARKGKKK